MNVAIPVLHGQIAPCFEAAKQFQIVSTKNKKIITTRKVCCIVREGFIQVRLLRLNDVHTLICNGIKSFYKDQLSSMGIVVIPNINLSVANALDLFLAGKLKVPNTLQLDIQSNDFVSHEELVSWAEKFFSSKGYSVSIFPEDGSFLIDLVASINCPLCGKKIEVAICCGAQIYRADQEIKEFHHATKTQYDARVYVYLTNPLLEKSCDEYGIEFLSPEIIDKNFIGGSKNLIPILRRPVEGHEKAFRIEA